MSEETKKVNYELAYRLILLVIETTPDRHDGSTINLDHARKILGATEEEFEAVKAMLQGDMLLNVTANGTLYIG
jgi:hypothetical protein